jgi:LuxR family maltose regulon positive regulatory protein
MHPSTKFRAPSVGPRAIIRTALIDRLRTAQPTAVMVHAPAGYGKTTAVTQWATADESAFSRTIWVNLDEDDDDPAGLWGAVRAGAGVAGIADPASTGSAAIETGAVRPTLIVPLIDALASASGRSLLVLDDLHLLRRDDTLASLDWFLGRIPTGVTVVLSSRSRPELGALDRLRARGAAVDLRPEDLRLSHEEIGMLLASAHSVEVAGAELDRVDEITAGWPAAVALIGSAIARGVPLDQAARLRGDGTGIDALVREGLSGGVPEEYELLRRVSIFERFDAVALDDVIGGGRAWRVAMDVAERTGLIAALGHDGRWWRMHHLVRERLQDELDREDPSSRRDLHRRAARALERENDISLTIHHLLGGEDYEAIADILSNVRANSMVPRQALGLSWLDRIPESALNRDPRLAFWEAWATATGGDPIRRDRALARGRMVAAATSIPGFASWDDVEDFILGSACYDDVGAARRAGERFLSRHTDGPIVPLARLRLATMLQLEGRPAEALRILDDIERSGPLARPLRLLVPSYRALGLLDQGELEKAAIEVERCAAARAAFRIGPDPVYLPAELALARTRTEQGDPAAGLTVALDALELGQELADTVLVVPQLLLEVGRARHALGDRGGAAVAVALAEELIHGAADAGALPRRILQLRERLGLTAEDTGARERLSRRELQVLALLPTSLSAAEIASELFISANTARSHIKSIHRKLAVSGRSEAVRAARRAGLLAEEGGTGVGPSSSSAPLR